MDPNITYDEFVDFCKTTAIDRVINPEGMVKQIDIRNHERVAKNPKNSEYIGIAKNSLDLILQLEKIKEKSLSFFKELKDNVKCDYGVGNIRLQPKKERIKQNEMTI